MSDETDGLKKQVAILKVMLNKATSYIPLSGTECNGYKCRKPWCRSCFDDESVNAALDEADELREAIEAINVNGENNG